MLPGTQVLRQIGLGFAQPSQIDDPADACLPGHLSEMPRRLHVHLVEPRAAAHAVDQVVGAVDAGKGLRQRFAVQRVALNYLHPFRPGTRAHPRRAAGQDAHAMAFVKESWSQPAADVAGGAGDEDCCRWVHAGGKAGHGAGDDALATSCCQSCAMTLVTCSLSAVRKGTCESRSTTASGTGCPPHAHARGRG